MNLRDRRSAIMAESSATINIPLNVNLITSENTESGYWDGRGALGLNYTSYGRTTGSYRRTLPLPFDSRCTFSASSLTVTGNTTGLALDENMICRGHIEVTTGEGIKNRCVAIEQDTGYTIKYVCFTFNTSASPSWIRTA